MNKLRDNIKAVHRQLEADLAAGDPKAKALVGMLRGETNAAREFLGMPPLPPISDIWIGFKFHAPTNGVLILGESTYGDDPPLREYVPLWIRRQVRDTTFTRLFNACSGSHTSRASEEQRGAFWHGIAFYNFVEQSVGPTRRHRPTPSHYKNATEAFRRVVERHHPRGVLILGTGQAEYSQPVLDPLSIPLVVTRHPTSWGLPTKVLTSAWNELRTKIA
jgi:hypothetical protein